MIKILSPIFVPSPPPSAPRVSPFRSWLHRFNYSRLSGAAMAAIFGVSLGLVAGAPLLSIVLAVFVLPLLTFGGAIAPRMHAVFNSTGARRPDFYQWRWGVTVWCVGFIAISVIRPYSGIFGGVATACLLALYMAAKWGCYRAGCCGAVPFRVVNATTSLAATEIRISCAFLIVVCLCVVLDRGGHAILIGLTSHATTRALSYWCRGERLSLRRLWRIPDIPALLIVIVIQSMSQPPAYSLGSAT